MRNLAIILPFKSILSGKFQRFNATDGSIEILKKVEFVKIVKHIMRPKTVRCVKEIIQGSVFRLPLSRITEYRCLKNLIHQIHSKSKWLLFSASFTAKFVFLFCLNTGKSFF